MTNMRNNQSERRKDLLKQSVTNQKQHWSAGLSANMAAPLPGRCEFFVQKKKRFCKMVVGRGKRFCGEHGAMEGDASRRIVCPLDPKHTVHQDKLENHLKRCNSREKSKPVYYVEDRNAGSADEDNVVEPVCLSNRSRAELTSLVDKLKTAVEGLQCDLEDSVLSHSILQDELNNPKNGDSAYKHLKQESSILGQLEALGLLGGGRCFVEFGAGRGKLSHWVHEALKTRDDLQLLLVERCSTRFKVDGKHLDAAAQFEHVQMDIQHLDLSKVPLLQQKKLPVVGVGKHLCGAATDLALRCLLEKPGDTGPAEPAQKRLKPSDPDPGLDPAADPAPDLDPAADPAHLGPSPAVLGLAVALCCHHRCQWRHYVGKRWFRQRGLGPAEFLAFSRMSSWATCGIRPANQDAPSQDPTSQKEGGGEEHEPAEETDAVKGFLSVSEREHIGRLCKLLIDSGRLDYLKDKGFDGRLRRYVSTAVTLENVLLTAIPSDDPSHDPSHDSSPAQSSNCQS